MSATLDFDRDVSVSVFETNIRVLGGLLSAHLVASDATTGHAVVGYTGGLLRLAVSLGERLLPAFSTPTGIPYGAVNLRRGVASNESRISSTAGGGTLALELGVLTRLTGDLRFEQAARRATRGLWARRSKLGLVGAHVDVMSGSWTHRDAGVGTSVDSFFEYLLKCALLFGDPECRHMFAQAHAAVERHCARAPWYVEVNMDTGTVVWPILNSLQAFWPGLQALAGRPEAGAATHAAFMSVWRRLGFLPEGFNLAAQVVQPGQASYPLRPELAESAYHLFQSTGERAYLTAGRDMVLSLRRARAPCGYATVQDVRTGELTDGMESFFLAETVKYLFLLFDAGAASPGGTPRGVNFVDSSPVGYVFNTEGHLFPRRPDWRQPGGAQEHARRRAMAAGNASKAGGGAEESSVSGVLRMGEGAGRGLGVTAAARSGASQRVAAAAARVSRPLRRRRKGGASGSQAEPPMQSHAPPFDPVLPPLLPPSLLGSCPAPPPLPLAAMVEEKGDWPAALALAISQFGPASPAVRALAAEVALAQQGLVAAQLIAHAAASGLPVAHMHLRVADSGRGEATVMLLLNGATQAPLWAQAPALGPTGLLHLPTGVLPQPELPAPTCAVPETVEEEDEYEDPGDA